MAIIQAAGLFYGDRLSACSDEARLYWPYFYTASNGFGRLEINYARIRSTVFLTFRNPPDEAKVMGLLSEYSEHHLLFIYRAPNGQIWGQWDTPANCLARHKTANDRRSPFPVEKLWNQWKTTYVDKKIALPHFFTQFRPGVGVGIGIGVGKDFGSAAANPEVQNPEPPPPLNPKPDPTLVPSQVPETFAAIRAIYPDADDMVILDLARVCENAAGKPASRIDQAIALGIAECYKPKRQTTVKLFFRTLPIWLQSDRAKAILRARQKPSPPAPAEAELRGILSDQAEPETVRDAARIMLDRHYPGWESAGQEPK